MLRNTEDVIKRKFTGGKNTTTSGSSHFTTVLNATKIKQNPQSFFYSCVFVIKAVSSWEVVYQWWSA